MNTLKHPWNFLSSRKFLQRWSMNTKFDVNPRKASVKGNTAFKVYFTTLQSYKFPLCTYERCDAISAAACGISLLFVKCWQIWVRACLPYTTVHKIRYILTVCKMLTILSQAVFTLYNSTQNTVYPYCL